VVTQNGNTFTNVVPHPVFQSQSAGSVDLVEILVASYCATPQEIVALCDVTARALALAKDRRRGFQPRVD
jgi:hypothetical protein